MDLPKITDPKFNQNITKKMKKYKINKEKQTHNKLCKNKGFKLQISQRFVADFINPKTKYKGLLIYHGIGSGKTCASINILEQWKKKKKNLKRKRTSLWMLIAIHLFGRISLDVRNEILKNQKLNVSERYQIAKYRKV